MATPSVPTTSTVQRLVTILDSATSIGAVLLDAATAGDEAMRRKLICLAVEEAMRAHSRRMVSSMRKSIGARSAPASVRKRSLSGRRTGVHLRRHHHTPARILSRH